MCVRRKKAEEAEEAEEQQQHQEGKQDEEEGEEEEEEGKEEGQTTTTTAALHNEKRRKKRASWVKPVSDADAELQMVVFLTKVFWLARQDVPACVQRRLFPCTEFMIHISSPQLRRLKTFKSFSGFRLPQAMAELTTRKGSASPFQKSDDGNAAVLDIHRLRYLARQRLSKRYERRRDRKQPQQQPPQEDAEQQQQQQHA